MTDKERKLNDVRDTYEDVLNRVRSSEREWKSFLSCEGRFVHYPFDVQLMIFAQRPGATACASYAQWEKRNCFPRRGSKGIPYIDYSGRNPQMRHIFDIADIVSRNGRGQLPSLWEFPADGHYVATLTGDHSECPMEFKIWDYVKGFISLEGTAERLMSMGHDGSEPLAREVEGLKDFFHASAAYAVCSRCGLDLSVCEALNEPLLRDNHYLVPNLDTEGLNVVAEGIAEFTKPIYEAIKAQIKLFDKNQATAKAEPAHRPVPSSGAMEEAVYAADTGPQGQLTLGLDENKSGRHGEGAGRQETTAGTGGGLSGIKAEPLGHYSNPIFKESVPAEVLQEVLRNGGSTRGSKLRMEKLYVGPLAMGHAPERAKAIQNEYGLYGRSSKPDDGYEGAFNYDTFGNGHKMRINWQAQGQCYKAEATWREIEKAIGTMIQEDRYIDPDERPVYDGEPASIPVPTPDMAVPHDALEQAPDQGHGPFEGLPSDIGQPPHVIEGSAAIANAAPSPGNYKIKDLRLNEEGGPKAKFAQNMEAILTLKTIEAEQRHARPEEQDTLAGYVGWGGLADAFDESKWPQEYQTLRETLGKNEYLSARSSTLNAHYTPPAIIKNMYQALENMGVERGNILDAGCGSGNFFGMLPDSMSGCKLYGVELDGLSGQVAQKLYPDANISITGYEKTKYPTNFFDVVVGNVPFGDYKVSDQAYDKHNFSIHDYFIAKSLDQLRPGGVLAAITSSWTMDKKNPSARKYFAERANLIGAIRLPDNAFKAAGTEAVADILFFQKLGHGQAADPDPAWLHVRKNIPDDHPIRIGDTVTSSRHDYRTRQKKGFDARVVSINQTSRGILYDLEDLDENEGTFAQYDNNVKLKSRNGMVYSCNQYFIENPGMVMGTLQYVSGPFGERLTCKASGTDLDEKLSQVINGSIHCEFRNTLTAGDLGPEKMGVIPADPHIRNYTYALVEGRVYYREDSVMTLEPVPDMDHERLKAMIGLRDEGYALLDAELNGDPDPDIRTKMAKLNASYDMFVGQFGYLQSKENRKLFSKDITYSFLRGFETVDESNNVSGKAAMFSKRVINPKVDVAHVDTANEALMVSLAEKGHIDLGYMAGLVGKDISETALGLSGVIFKDPDKASEDPHSGYVTADEYLSGNVKLKLEKAIQHAERDPSYGANVECLKQVQPEPLEAPEIDVRLGAAWIEPEYIEQFLKETFQVADWRFTDYANKSERLTVSFETLGGEWNISNKATGDAVLLAATKYGTERKNGFHILENCLNLRDSKVYDQEWNPEKQRYDSVPNKEETAICNQKADLLKGEFENWIFAEPERRNYLVKKYNDLYNNLRPRQYDGSHLTFPGMNPEIKLMPHQKNAVARILYGKNTLLAHVVGAGKTYEMAASIMEQKRIGLCNKALIVVPNHLTEQWGRDFTGLYPAARLLVARKDDFTPDRRREFCSKIATGEYDAVVIGHTQFEKIPLSVERQRHYIDQQLSDIQRAVEGQKRERGQTFTVKQLEKTEKKLRVKLEKLNNEGKRDNVITFEQLGIDRLYVDESHSYKNLFLYTKMSNVAGIQQTEAQKSTDMYMKCQYMDETAQGKCGIVFASGTPISNSMTELYTNMRYLQADLLKRYGLENFDAWASTFGNIQTAVELSPEGTNYRFKKRFSSFFNIPELMNLWKESADVQTADMLNLSVPTAAYVNIKLAPSRLQQKMVESLAERADAVRNQTVDPSVDNLLKITNDGRKLALDQRLINPNMPDVPESKVNVCAKQAYGIWELTMDRKSAQIIFCDLSTPKADGSFSVYDSLKSKLVEMGVPAAEIAYIHDAKTDMQKDNLFKKVRSGDVRFLIGSTFMMGAGTNVQKNLVAQHHLDIPWRPSDIEQREGRIIRQGNLNRYVLIFRYITSGTFDAYSWQVIENKQKFISQIMTSKSPVRSCSDLDEQSLSYAEVKALATGNPYIKEKMELDISVSQLNRERANHKSDIYRYQDDYTIKYPKEINRLEHLIQGIKSDIERYKENAPEADGFLMEVGGRPFRDRKEAGEALIAAANEACASHDTEHQIGTYLGFGISARKGTFSIVPELIVSGDIKYKFDMSVNTSSNLASITKAFHSLADRVADNEKKLISAQGQLETAKRESEKPYPKEGLYQSQLERLNELNTLLGISEKNENETGAMDESGTIQLEPQGQGSSWDAFTGYDPDADEGMETGPEPGTAEYLVVGAGDGFHLEAFLRDMDESVASRLPIGAMALLDYVRDSAMLLEALPHTNAAAHPAVCQRYDKAWAAADLKDGIPPKAAILQLRPGEENAHRRPVGLEALRKPEEPSVENYELIHVRDLDNKVEGETEKRALCGRLYRELNSGPMQPHNYYGSSPSVGDVIVVFNDISDHSAYFVSNAGFATLPDSFLSHEMNAKIRNSLDIRQECALYQEIERFKRESQVVLADKGGLDRAGQIIENYAAIFELADRRKAMMEVGDLKGTEQHGNDHWEDRINRGQAAGQLPSLPEDLHIEATVDKGKGPEYGLVFGSVGNGITVWNQNEPIHAVQEDGAEAVSDYRALAHVSPDGNRITWYADGLPDSVKAAIVESAERQKESHGLEGQKAIGIDYEQDLSNGPADIGRPIAGTNPVYTVEQVGHHQAGGKPVSGMLEFTDPLEAYAHLEKSFIKQHNLYVCSGEEGGRRTYRINQGQLKSEAIKSILGRHGLPQHEKDVPPFVRIEGSESKMFHEAGPMSFFDADNRLTGYNEAAKEIKTQGYEKTDFSIYMLKDGELHTYYGRYDIGSESGGLLEHIDGVNKERANEWQMAAMKAHYGQEEYEEWLQGIHGFTDMWLPTLQAEAHVPRSPLQPPGSDPGNKGKASETARHRAEYLKAHRPGYVSLDDGIYTFYQDGKAIRAAVGLKQAALGLLTAKAFGEGEGYRLTMKAGEKEATLLSGNHQGIEMPVEAINHSIDISKNPSIKDILKHVVETMKPQVRDPYNRMDMPFEEYAAHQESNPWKDPAAMYRAAGLQVTEAQKTALDTLNREVKCFLKPADVLKISKLGKPEKNAPSICKEEIFQSVKLLAESYVEQQPGSISPDLDLQAGP